MNQIWKVQTWKIHVKLDISHTQFNQIYDKMVIMLTSAPCRTQLKASNKEKTIFKIHLWYESMLMYPL